jgi:hypothetical protein
VNEISPAMMEIIMVAPQEWKSRITIWFFYATPEHKLKGL